MKFTQWLATRPDILPLSACIELQEIQTDSYSPPKADSLAIIHSSLGPEVLAQLGVDEDSAVVVGNGCVAQVLYFQQQATGRETAIKVIHPHTARNIDLDIRIMHYMATIAGRI